MSKQMLVAANWKMNGNKALVDEMTKAIEAANLDNNTKIVLCPSFPYLACFDQTASQKFALGAQNMSEFEKGAYTGEVSAAMLQEFHCEYVILGHSERRSLYHETSNHVALKVKQALLAGFKVILCIGESEAEREAGHTETVLASQLQPVIDQVGIAAFNNIVIAYEPVWAIGTGKTASPEMAQATHQYIRSFLANLDNQVAESVAILYGGSVNEKNCEQLFSQKDIDGGLIGGASLKVDEFMAICQTAKGQ